MNECVILRFLAPNKYYLQGITRRVTKVSSVLGNKTKEEQSAISIEQVRTGTLTL